MTHRHILPALLTTIGLFVVGCGVPEAETLGANAAQLPTTSTESENTTTVETGSSSEPIPTTDVETDDNPAFECPVTIPPQPGFAASEPDDATYSQHFPAPDPWPAEYPYADTVWYGTDDLWTALPTDGEYGTRKSVWWSSNFEGGISESEPEVWVTWTRLDTDEPVTFDNAGKATNAHTPTDGWFMIAGIDPGEPGCWEVTATYKGATLTYVYETAAEQLSARRWRQT
jgi:hypothetical protein